MQEYTVIFDNCTITANGELPLLSVSVYWPFPVIAEGQAVRIVSPRKFLSIIGVELLGQVPLLSIKQNSERRQHLL